MRAAVSRVLHVAQEIFIDAFSEGQFHTRSELQDILVHIVTDSTNPAYLRPVKNSEVWCVDSVQCAVCRSAWALPSC